MTHSHRLIRAIFRNFIGRLRVIRDRNAPAYFGDNPEASRECATCAFEPSTDGWQGFDATMMHLQKAIAEDRPFFCHHGMTYVKGHGWIPPLKINSDGRTTEDTTKMRLCVGWWIVFQDPATREAFALACDEVMFRTPEYDGGRWPVEYGGGA